MDDPHQADVVDETPQASFAAELRRLRLQAGLTVRALAQKLHRAHSSIVEYEHASACRASRASSNTRTSSAWRAERWLRSASAHEPQNLSLRVTAAR